MADTYEALKVKREERRHSYIPQSPIVGTCMDMCPKYERYEREAVYDLSPFETLDGIPNKVDHLKAVKKYHRAAAGNEMPLPEDVRPPSILQKTLIYLMEDIVSQIGMENAEHSLAVYNFVRDRLRAVKQDLTLQQYQGPEAIHILETVSRFHIQADYILSVQGIRDYSHKQNMEQLRKTLHMLIETYEDVRRLGGGQPASQYESEMRSYYMLVHMDDLDTLRRCLLLPPDIIQSQEMKAGLLLVVCLKDSNYGTLFRLLRDTNILGRASRFSYLQFCLINDRLADLRVQALHRMSVCFSGTEEVFVSDLSRMLGFLGEEDARPFLSQAIGIVDHSIKIRGIQIGEDKTQRPSIRFDKILPQNTNLGRLCLEPDRKEVTNKLVHLVLDEILRSFIKERVFGILLEIRIWEISVIVSKRYLYDTSSLLVRKKLLPFVLSCSIATKKTISDFCRNIIIQILRKAVVKVLWFRKEFGILVLKWKDRNERTKKIGNILKSIKWKPEERVLGNDWMVDSDLTLPTDGTFSYPRINICNLQDVLDIIYIRKQTKLLGVIHTIKKIADVSVFIIGSDAIPELYRYIRREEEFLVPGIEEEFGVSIFYKTKPSEEFLMLQPYLHVEVIDDATCFIELEKRIRSILSIRLPLYPIILSSAIRLIMGVEKRGDNSGILSSLISGFCYLMELIEKATILPRNIRQHLPAIVPSTLESFGESPISIFSRRIDDLLIPLEKKCPMVFCNVFELEREIEASLLPVCTKRTPRLKTSVSLDAVDEGEISKMKAEVDLRMKRIRKSGTRRKL